MKNNILSLILFGAVLIFVIFASSNLISMFDKIEDTCNLIENHIKEERYEEAYEASLSLITILEKENFINSVYTTHSDLDDLLNKSISLIVSIKNQNYIVALDTLHILKYTTVTLKELQQFSIENIF